jgi:N-acetylglutamate synthase-like GNAT family acetyltransferase
VNVTLRTATSADTAAIHALVSANVKNGHLLPRSLEEIEEHSARFVVAVLGGDVVGCAELARLSGGVAEVRSLVVQDGLRGRKIGTQLVDHLSAMATAAGYGTLCAFTHNPAHFVRLGFTIVPHIWMPEKIAHDCTGCALFRRCGQYAVRLPLQRGIAAAPERSAAMVYGRGVAPRRPNIERLQLAPAASPSRRRDEEAVPA